jgi:hypothetical protein
VVVKTFSESIEIVDLPNASYFATDLFKECFASAFPARIGPCWSVTPRAASTAVALLAVVLSPGLNPAFIYFQF